MTAKRRVGVIIARMVSVIINRKAGMITDSWASSKEWIWAIICRVDREVCGATKWAVGREVIQDNRWRRY